MAPCPGPSPSAASAAPRSRFISPSFCSSSGSPPAPGRQGGPGAALDSTLFIVLLFFCVVLHEFGHITRRPPIRHPVAPGDAAADRRRRQHAAPAERSAPGAGRRARRTRGQSRHRPRAVACAGSLRLGLACRDRRPPPVADRPARRGQYLSGSVQPDPRLSDGRRPGPACAPRHAHGRAHATEVAAKIGQAFAIGLGFLGLFGNPLLLFIAIFIYMVGSRARRR